MKKTFFIYFWGAMSFLIASQSFSSRPFEFNNFESGRAGFTSQRATNSQLEAMRNSICGGWDPHSQEKHAARVMEQFGGITMSSTPRLISGSTHHTGTLVPGQFSFEVSGNLSSGDFQARVTSARQAADEAFAEVFTMQVQSRQDWKNKIPLQGLREDPFATETSSSSSQEKGFSFTPETENSIPSRSSNAFSSQKKLKSQKEKFIEAEDEDYASLLRRGSFKKQEKPQEQTFDGLSHPIFQEAKEEALTKVRAGGSAREDKPETSSRNQSSSFAQRFFEDPCNSHPYAREACNKIKAGATWLITPIPGFEHQPIDQALFWDHQVNEKLKNDPRWYVKAAGFLRENSDEAFQIKRLPETPLEWLNLAAGVWGGRKAYTGKGGPSFKTSKVFSKPSNDNSTRAANTNQAPLPQATAVGQTTTTTTTSGGSSATGFQMKAGPHTRRTEAFQTGYTSSEGTMTPTRISTSRTSTEALDLAWTKSWEQNTPLLEAPRMVKHHLFNKFRGQSEKSQKYREFFKMHGIDVDNYAVEITDAIHKTKIHTLGNNWTTKWKIWIDNNPNASTTEVYQFVGKLMDEYGLSHVPIVKYKK